MEHMERYSDGSCALTKSAVQPGNGFSRCLADSSCSIFCGSSLFANSCCLCKRFGNCPFFFVIVVKGLPNEILKCCIR